jgi:hypothetical protein
MDDNRTLHIWAALFEDQQNVRIAHALRIRDMKADGRWNDLIGAQLVEALKAAEGLEKLAERRLAAAVKAHRLGPFIEQTVGLGHASMGRLLTEIGDPSWHSADNRPRALDELYAYCGMSVVKSESPKRQRGKQGNWNDNARKWIIMIADRCITLNGEPDKNDRPRPRSPYRDIYDDAKERYADAVHTKPCPRCGSKRVVNEDGTVEKNVPAPVGSPLSDNHQHARARRLVAKAILRDLWRADRNARKPLRGLALMRARRRAQKAA